MFDTDWLDQVHISVLRGQTEWKMSSPSSSSWSLSLFVFQPVDWWWCDSTGPLCWLGGAGPGALDPGRWTGDAGPGALDRELDRGAGPGSWTGGRWTGVLDGSTGRGRWAGRGGGQDGAVGWTGRCMVWGSPRTTLTHLPLDIPPAPGNPGCVDMVTQTSTCSIDQSERL